MRTIKFIPFTFMLLLISVGASAQSGSKEVLHIKSARFAEPLVEQWAAAYENANPGIEITVSSDPGEEGGDLSFIGSRAEGASVDGNRTVVFTGRYALLPIANEENPILSDLNKKRLNAKRLQEFFFESGIADGGSGSSGDPANEVTIYSGNIPGSSADRFASHFGYDAADLRGRRISGDDIFLINAVQKDPRGVTFNNLSYLYDKESRQLKEGLALLPLDVKRGQHEILESADIDKTIALLEEENIPLIPVEHVGFVYQNDNQLAKEFLYWVLSEGQKYNHTHGFLSAPVTQFAAEPGKANF